MVYGNYVLVDIIFDEENLDRNIMENFEVMEDNKVTVMDIKKDFQVGIIYFDVTIQKNEEKDNNSKKIVQENVQDIESIFEVVVEIVDYNNIIEDDDQRMSNMMNDIHPIYRDNVIVENYLYKKIVHLDKIVI